MKIINAVSLGLALSLASGMAGAGQSLQVSKDITLSAKYDDVLAYVGDFCAIETWHPAVAKCEIVEEADSKFRVLTLGDGATIKEKHGGKNPGGYMYSITESPLPVKDYFALFELESKDGATVVSWSATFLANGVPDSEAKEVISGIFDAGLAGIAKKFE